MDHLVQIIPNMVVVALGFMITFELRDIKQRIVRLENIFIRSNEKEQS